MPTIIDAALSYAHFIAAFIVAGALIAEFYLMRLPPTGDTIRSLARADALFGLSALLVIAAGLGRVYFGLKGADYYFANHAFWAKMAAFAAVGIISVWPTMRFLRWRKALVADAAFSPAEAEIKSTRRLIMIELHVFALVPLFAVLMARAFG